MKQFNPEHREAIMRLVAHAPYFKLLSITLTALEPGYARAEAPRRESHLNPYGWVHGGVYASLMDAAAYWSVYGGLEEGAVHTTLDLQINYLLASQTGVMIAEARPIKLGRRVLLAEASLRDGEGRLLAQGYSKMAMLGGEGSVRAMQSSALEPLPPKFIA